MGQNVVVDNRGSLLAWVPNGVVSLPTLPAKNIQELIALAKSQPGKLTYASFGVGSSAHLTFELFKEMAGIDMLHVPYKGGQPAIADLARRPGVDLHPGAAFRRPAAQGRAPSAARGHQRETLFGGA